MNGESDISQDTGTADHVDVVLEREEKRVLVLVPPAHGCILVAGLLASVRVVSVLESLGVDVGD